MCLEMTSTDTMLSSLFGEDNSATVNKSKSKTNDSRSAVPSTQSPKQSKTTNIAQAEVQVQTPKSRGTKRKSYLEDDIDASVDQSIEFPPQKKMKISVSKIK